MTAILYRNAPIVGTFHAAGESFAYRWLGPGVRWLSSRLDLRCAVSEDARQLAHDALGGDYQLLFNGIEVERFAKATPWPTDAPTIFFVGRHEPRKGLAVMLAALGYVPADVRVWVAGDGPETERLKAEHRDDRIEWLGRIDDEEKASRLRGASLLCAPSLRGESFGVVLLEGMAAATPVVASDLPGYRNVARAGADAVLVPPGDPHKLGLAMRQVLEDPALASRLVCSGRERADEYSMQNLANRYLELYASVR
jgi:phosphatidylinositol alpha-mannosyltransferase